MPIPSIGNNSLVWYVYDSRTQCEEPVFVVYNREHIQTIASALFGSMPDWLLVSTRRLHPWNPNETYRGRPSKGK